MLWYLALTVTVLIVGGVLALILYGLYAMVQEYRRDRVPMLLYHQFISKAKVDSGEVVNHEPVYVCYDTVFDEQMAYLHREGYTTISLDDFLAFQDGKQPLPPKPILLTFDDGFMSNYLYAFPVLKKYGLKATIFVTPDTESENFKKYASSDSPLTHEQLREMSEYGISIESHAMTHRYLTELEPKVIQWELEESKTVLERILHKPVHFLAIPSGAYNRTVRRLAKQAGYQAVFCMLKGSNNARSDRYALRRLVIARDYTIEDFRKTLEPATTCHLRITSFFQNLLLNTLGPKRFDAFRNSLYRTRFAPLLVQGQLKYFVRGFAAVTAATLIVSLIILFYGNL